MQHAKDTTTNPEGSGEKSAAPAGYVGYGVCDPLEKEIGKVQRVLGKVQRVFANASGGLEYVRVKTGLFGMKSFLLPVQDVTVDEERRILVLS
ncbi:MAG: hypothetical protein H0V53_06355 [Rubrobacter sp.]|jgi:hypothetical protein|nr:hypothetical protein [Rubrobacter sp.]